MVMAKGVQPANLDGIAIALAIKGQARRRRGGVLRQRKRLSGG